MSSQVWKQHKWKVRISTTPARQHYGITTQVCVSRDVLRDGSYCRWPVREVEKGHVPKTLWYSRITLSANRPTAHPYGITGADADPEGIKGLSRVISLAEALKQNTSLHSFTIHSSTMILRVGIAIARNTATRTDTQIEDSLSQVAEVGQGLGFGQISVFCQGLWFRQALRCFAGWTLW